MIMHKGGTVVAKGSYWNPVNGERVTMRMKGILPGDDGRAYLKMSPAGLLVIAPLCGTMFITFLPLFGIGVLFILCLVPLIGTLGSVALAGVRVCCSMANGRTSVNWTPTRASFTGVRSKSAIRGYTLGDKSRAVGSPAPARLDPFKNISVG